MERRNIWDDKNTGVSKILIRKLEKCRKSDLLKVFLYLGRELDCKILQADLFDATLHYVDTVDKQMRKGIELFLLENIVAWF